MKCPMCDRPINNALQKECDCGESLIVWRSLFQSSQSLRQRGLAQAVDENYVGACISFLEASLTNPADDRNLIDAAKAMAYCGCYQEARQLLQNADARYREPATDVLKAIQELEKQAKKRTKNAAAPSQPMASPTPEPPPASETTTAESMASQEQKPAIVANGDRRPVAQPLLQLGILKRKEKVLKRVFSWGKGTRFPALWTTVLRMENTWPRDWQSLQPWLAAAAGEAARTSDGSTLEEAVFHYMLGLGNVQANQREAAVSAFQRCLDLKPPVLNPAAYYLYLHLDNQDNARQAVQRLETEYDTGEREECCKHLLDRLAKRGEASKMELLKKLAKASSKS